MIFYLSQKKHLIPGFSAIVLMGIQDSQPSQLQFYLALGEALMLQWMWTCDKAVLVQSEEQC